MKVFNWMKNRISHKLEHLSLSYFKDILKKHGIAFLVIVIGWEIIEDIIFPLAFAYLGKYVDPIFYSGIPASIFLCLHWLAIPILFGAWLKISGQNKEHIHKDDCCH